MDVILKENVNKKVRITHNKYGYEMYTMRDGVQWTGFIVDEEMLEIMRDAINAFLSHIQQDVQVDADNLPTLDDGFGNTWVDLCGNCGVGKLEVVRPGKVQCSRCGK